MNKSSSKSKSKSIQTIFDCFVRFIEGETIGGPNDRDNGYFCEKCSRLTAPNSDEDNGKEIVQDQVQDRDKDQSKDQEREQEEQGNSGQDFKPKIVLREASKQFTIEELPQILTLHLKRFKASIVVKQDNSKKKKGGISVTKTVTKNSARVLFPLVLRGMSSFSTPANHSCEKELEQEEEEEFELFGVVEHQGSILGGHYVCYAKTIEICEELEQGQNHQEGSRENEETKQAAESEPEHKNSSKTRQTKWFYFSDSSHHAVSEEEVLSSQAYILFYKRCNKK